ncbi:hypothetical protein PAALTS15_09970 [Paenibacillus alvei TS-15]|uniref:DUF3310 domain-containing protein n=1 Tax=Paenibacillus alvei TS-15 TaxID=1117108 RepID=S9STH8_PAEAL|nr:DUF3310 domain-containing protein [Paenibacillus alvei]EPY07443.1 hypothetical protein PAALTS15_09970 [Paenibacillus alvei TS-15]
MSGTPIPRRENELKATNRSEVTSYFLSEEELAKYRAMPEPSKNDGLSVRLRMASREAENRQLKKSEAEAKGDSNVTTEKLSKEQYLKLRALGKTHDQIECIMNLSKGTLSAYWLRKWDLKGVTAEKAQELLEAEGMDTQDLVAVRNFDQDLKRVESIAVSTPDSIQIERLMIELNETKQRIADYESELARWAQQDSDNAARIDELQEDISSWKLRAEELKQQRDDYKRSYEELILAAEQNTEEPERHPESDEVERPSRYTFGGIETIDYIRAKLTPEEFRGYCKGNVLKYVSRERWKGKDEDLQKSMKYLEFMLTGN